jgi:DNA repair photolyase
MTTILSKSRIEYLEYGVNWRKGCSHSCRYCYMAGLVSRFDHLMPECGDWSESELRVEDPLDALVNELSSRRATIEGPLMLSTSHDPAMTDEVAAEMAEIVAGLAGFNLLDRTLLLTKAPKRALDALRRSGSSEGLRFGTSLTSLGVWLTNHYEPGAEMPFVRRAMIKVADTQGYRTWLSLEPPLPDVYLCRLVESVIDLAGEMTRKPWVVLGKLNARGSQDEDLARWAASDHWAADRDRAVELLEEAGFEESLAPIDGGYWIKSELRQC